MKKITIIAVAMICLLSLTQTAFSQSTGPTYRTALGAKAYFGDGTTGGINLKHFLNSKGALEASLLFERGHLGVEGLYDWHGDITGASGLKWYVGGGALLFFPTDDDYGDDVLFALRGTLGLDYKFTGAPINVSFDLNPVFALTPDTDFDFWAGLAFRFTF
ncbi:hypothetical protein HB364_28885 [Pseudoflavitalea sp. X16]|uniref:hypothetical protein n=1 Tax=Paraflavitalea devenefica TaxID=2716334 RepID=UPI0014244594|nr:hypothetical protein [Paraflavitalea devenefica]NII29129.1 hypothetical protein [Paraflavitalea devenefica]